MKQKKLKKKRSHPGLKPRNSKAMESAFENMQKWALR